MRLIYINNMANKYLAYFPKHLEDIRGRPFDSWGGGGGAMVFCEKKIVQQILENK